MRTIARDLSDLGDAIIEDDPTFNEVARTLTVEEEPARWSAPIQRNSAALNRERIAAERASWTQADQALSDALHSDDVARDATAAEYDELLDADPRVRSAFRIPQVLLPPEEQDDEEDGSPDPPDYVARAYKEFGGAWRLVPWDTADTIRDEVQPERFSSAVPLSDHLAFPARWDGVAGRRARELSYEHRSLNGAREAILEGARSRGLALPAPSPSRRQLAEARLAEAVAAHPPRLRRKIWTVSPDGTTVPITRLSRRFKERRDQFARPYARTFEDPEGTSVDPDRKLIGWFYGRSVPLPSSEADIFAGQLRLDGRHRRLRDFNRYRGALARASLRLMRSLDLGEIQV